MSSYNERQKNYAKQLLNKRISSFKDDTSLERKYSIDSSKGTIKVNDTLIDHLIKETELTKRQAIDLVVNEYNRAKRNSEKLKKYNNYKDGKKYDDYYKRATKKYITYYNKNNLYDKVIYMSEHLNANNKIMRGVVMYTEEELLEAIDILVEDYGFEEDEAILMLEKYKFDRDKQGSHKGYKDGQPHEKAIIRPTFRSIPGKRVYQYDEVDGKTKENDEYSIAGKGKFNKTGKTFRTFNHIPKINPGKAARTIASEYSQYNSSMDHDVETFGGVSSGGVKKLAKHIKFDDEKLSKIYDKHERNAKIRKSLKDNSGKIAGSAAALGAAGGIAYLAYKAHKKNKSKKSNLREDYGIIENEYGELFIENEILDFVMESYDLDEEDAIDLIMEVYEEELYDTIDENY